MINTRPVYTGVILDGENTYLWRKDVVKFLKNCQEWRAFRAFPTPDNWRDLPDIRDAQESAIALLGTTVINSIYDLVLARQESAKGSWDALMTTFTRPNRMKASSINATLKALRFSSGSHLKFVENLENLVNELAF